MSSCFSRSVSYLAMVGLFPSSACCLAEYLDDRVLDGSGDAIRLILRQNQRRSDGDAVVTGTHNDPALAGRLCQPRADAVGGRERLLRVLVLHHLDDHHHALAAHVADVLVTEQFFELAEQVAAYLAG